MQKTNCFFIFLKGNQMVAYNVSGMDAVFKALADASRRKLLDQLRAENGQTLGDLCAHLDMTRQAVSKHLAILEAANLVVAVWSGRTSIRFRSMRSANAGSENSRKGGFRPSAK
jgi:DNA-binding transcriptional ArsR family regulator